MPAVQDASQRSALPSACPERAAARPRRSARPAGPAPDLDDLAHGGGPPGDPVVQRAHDELEAPGLQLLELGDERVEAAALLVHEHDVARADALGGQAL